MTKIKTLPLGLKKFIALSILGYGLFLGAQNVISPGPIFLDIHPNRQITLIHLQR